jgi:hypothetical protein
MRVLRLIAPATSALLLAACLGGCHATVKPRAADHVLGATSADDALGKLKKAAVCTGKDNGFGTRGSETDGQGPVETFYNQCVSDGTYASPTMVVVAHLVSSIDTAGFGQRFATGPRVPRGTAMWFAKGVTTDWFVTAGPDSISKVKQVLGEPSITAG